MWLREATVSFEALLPIYQAVYGHVWDYSNFDIRLHEYLCF